MYKQAKKDHKDAKWSIDKLVVDGHVQEVKKDCVNDVNLDTTDKAIDLQQHVRHSLPQSYKGSTFQGHMVEVKCQDDVIPALHAIYSDSRVARAKHNIYAYRIKSGDRFIEHYDDDGEWGAGTKLLNMLRENNVENALVCGTRWYSGSHIGRIRFTYLCNVVSEVLK